jgi:AcrR family transcriptional regulator
MSRREEAKDERRRRIVTAARDLIRETGDAGVSMRAIADRADVSISTPYNLFGSKRAVVLAVLEDIRGFSERFARLRPTSALERIFQVLSMSIRYYVDDPGFYRALWTGVFDMSHKEVRSDLAMPERDAFWLFLIDTAARDGALSPEIDTAMLLRSLDLAFAAAMLSWRLRLRPGFARGGVARMATFSRREDQQFSETDAKAAQRHCRVSEALAPRQAADLAVAITAGNGRRFRCRADRRQLASL